MLGEPICVRTLSSHCRGPLRCSSIQQGVLVTVCLLPGREHMTALSPTELSMSEHSQLLSAPSCLHSPPAHSNVCPCNSLWPVLLFSHKTPPCPFSFVMIPQEPLAVCCSDSWDS